MGICVSGASREQAPGSPTLPVNQVSPSFSDQDVDLNDGNDKTSNTTVNKLKDIDIAKPNNSKNPNSTGSSIPVTSTTKKSCTNNTTNKASSSFNSKKVTLTAEESIAKLIPESNKVEKLQHFIRYIKVLGKGATSQVVLATYVEGVNITETGTPPSAASLAVSAAPSAAPSPTTTTRSANISDVDGVTSDKSTTQDTEKTESNGTTMTDKDKQNQITKTTNTETAKTKNETKTKTKTKTKQNKKKKKNKKLKLVNEENEDNEIADNEIEDMLGQINANADPATIAKDFMKRLESHSIGSNASDSESSSLNFLQTINSGDDSDIKSGSESPSKVSIVNNSNRKSSIHKRYRFALKQMQKLGENDTKFIREGNILRSLNHPNVVSIMTCYMDNLNYYIATKYCYGGSLLNFIIQCKYFNEKQASYCVKSILHTIKYIHDRNIVHRDLKPGNIMFNKIPILNTNGKPGFANDAKLIIIDFGEAVQVEKDKIYDDKVGTIVYLPPEVQRSRKGWELKAGDIWSIGVIAYILLCGKAPFYDPNKEKTLNIIANNPLEWPNKRGLSISDRGKKFVNKLMKKEPKDRVTARQAIEDGWIMDGKNNPCHGLPLAVKDPLLANIADFHHAGILLQL